MLDATVGVIASILGRPGSIWDNDDISKLGHFTLPDVIFRQRGDLAAADFNHLWLSWYISALVSKSTAENGGFLDIYQSIKGGLDDQLSGTCQPEQLRGWARSLTAVVFDHHSNRRGAGRRALKEQERRELVGSYEGKVRCNICGYAFSQEQVDGFLGLRDVEEHGPLPAALDIAKPIGRRRRDIRIEVDHIVPIRHGGGYEENLQILCGWCNSIKSAYRGLYDVPGDVVDRAGWLMPQPFWVVRIIGTRRRCEHPRGCGATARDAELTVDRVLHSGEFNPANMRVVCYSHDAMGESRWINRASLV